MVLPDTLPSMRQRSRAVASLALLLSPTTLASCGDSSADADDPSNGGSGAGGSMSTASANGGNADGGSPPDGGGGSGANGPLLYDVTVEISGAEEGRVVSSPAGIDCGPSLGACSAAFPAGEQVVLTPAELTDVRLRWSAGPCLDEVGACAFDVQGTVAVEGAYLPTSTLDFVVDGEAQISVDGVACTEPCSTVVDIGSPITFEVAATDDDSYRVGTIDTGSCTGDALAQLCTLTPASATTVNVTSLAHVSAAPDPLVAGNLVGSGIDCGAGDTACDVYVPLGTTVDLSYELASGYQIAEWTGACAGTLVTPAKPHCNFVVDSPAALGASFVEGTTWSFSVTFVSSGGSTGSGFGTLRDSTSGPPASPTPQYLQLQCSGASPCVLQQTIPEDQRWLHFALPPGQEGGIDIEWFVQCLQQVDIHEDPSNPCDTESWCLIDFSNTLDPILQVQLRDRSGSGAGCMF